MKSYDKLKDDMKIINLDGTVSYDTDLSNCISYVSSGKLVILKNYLQNVGVLNELTKLFIENYNTNGNFEKIYIKEVLGANSSKIITANYGKVIKKNNKYFLKLNKGGITNIEKNNTYSVNFLTTEYDLSKFSSKTLFLAPYCLATSTKRSELDEFLAPITTNKSVLGAIFFNNSKLAKIWMLQ